VKQKNVILKVELLFIFMLCFIHINQAQTLDFSTITLHNNPHISGSLNGANMGGYSYARINEMGGNVNVTNECIQCSASPLLCNANQSGVSYLNMNTNPLVVDATLRLKPEVLRFPGGTHSGWYHLYEYNTDGLYNAASPQIKKGYGMTLIETAHLNNPLSYCRADSRLMVNKNYIEGFINYINNYHNSEGNSHRIHVSYVANLLTHFRFPADQTICSACSRQPAFTPMANYNCHNSFSYSYEGNEELFDNDIDIYRFELYYKETQDAIEMLIDELNYSIDDVLYVELGNEYYGPMTYSEARFMMNVNNYARLAQIYSERLKCYFDGVVQIKTGIVTSVNTPWQNNLAGLMEQDLTGSGGKLGETIDAIILHEYYTSNNCLNDNNIQTRFECGKNSLNTFLTENVVNKLNSLRVAFPAQKLWLTEWNVVEGTDNKNLSYINTILHACFAQEYLGTLIKYNAQHENFVEMATHHRLGDHNAWSVIQTQEGSSLVSYRSGAYALQFLSKMYESDSTYYFGNILMNGNESFNSQEATTFVLHQTTQNQEQQRILLYFTNKTENDINYTIPHSIDGFDVTSAKLSYVQGDYLFSYGPCNTTAGRNRFTVSANLTHYNEDLDLLGFGLLHNQFRTTTDSIINTEQAQVIPKYAAGVLELIMEQSLLSEFDEKSTNITIYPNPANKRITIRTSQTHYEVSIYTITGRQIMQKTNSSTIDISDIAAGTYIVLFKSGDTISRRKLVVE